MSRSGWRNRGSLNEAQKDDPSEDDKNPAAQRLVKLVLNTVDELWHTPNLEPYLTREVGSRLEHMALL